MCLQELEPQVVLWAVMGEYRSLETTWHDDMEKGFVSMGLVRSIGIRGIGGSIYQSSKYLVINYRIYSV